MSNKTLSDVLLTFVQSESNNNPPPKSCKIVGNYDDKPYCDVEVEDLGKLTYKKTIGSTEIGVEGIICFLDGDLSQGIVITDGNSKLILELVNKLGFNQQSADKFNFAIITRSDEYITYEEFWMLSNAYYDYESGLFKKIDLHNTSFGIQIQAKGAYPGEAALGYTDNSGINIWRNPSLENLDWAPEEEKTLLKQHIIGEYDSNNDIKVFQVSCGWNNAFMFDSYGGMTIGGTGFEIDGNGIFPYTRIANCIYTNPEDGKEYGYISILDNAYNSTRYGWDCDSNRTFSWFAGIHAPVDETLGGNNLDLSKADFRVMYNDTPWNSNNTHELDITKWHTVLKVDTNSITGLIDGNLRELGDYNFLKNKPVIPSKTSELTNDSGFLTSHQGLSDYLTESEINTLLSSYVLSSSLNNYYTKSEVNNSFATKNHMHPDTNINWNGSALAGSVSPIDMAMYEEFSANRLAYLSGNNITVEYSTDGGSTWNDYGATASDKLELVTTSHGFIAGKGATASANNQLRITLNAGGGNNVQSDVYLATRKLMIYYGTGGGSNTKVKIQTSNYGTPTTWNTVGEFNISGWSGWNSYPLNITFGGYANQTTGTRIQNIRLIFKTGTNHNFTVHKIRLFGENCWIKPSTLADTGHMYTFDNNKNVIFPAKIIKNGGTSDQFLKADGSVDSNSYALSNHSHNELNDSGWIDVPNANLNGNFFNYYTLDLVHYRKLGKTVYLAGTVMVNGNLSIGEWVIMNLPAGFRPSREVSALCELVNTTSLWTCTIKTNGDVCFNNLRDSDVKRTAIQWTDVLRFDVSFVI